MLLRCRTIAVIESRGRVAARRRARWARFRASASRRMTTPWGAAMSVAMTNCGEAGWLSDPAATVTIELTQKPAGPWPAMRLYFSPLATTNSNVRRLQLVLKEGRVGLT